MSPVRVLLPPFLASLLLVAGCGDVSRPDHDASAHDTAHGHAHVAPHGGTVVVLGDELYHLEFVLDADTGRLTAWVLDGHLEEFIRISATELPLSVTFAGETRELKLAAVASRTTGESVGDTSMFAGEADWLQGRTNFTATITALSVRNRSFTNIAFHFPEGNE